MTMFFVFFGLALQVTLDLIVKNVMKIIFVESNELEKDKEDDWRIFYFLAKVHCGTLKTQIPTP